MRERERALNHDIWKFKSYLFVLGVNNDIELAKIIASTAAAQLRTSVSENYSFVSVKGFRDDKRIGTTSVGNDREIGVNGESLVAGSVLPRQGPNVRERVIAVALINLLMLFPNPQIP